MRRAAGVALLEKVLDIEVDHSDEVTAWATCEDSRAGDRLAWDTADLVITGDLQLGEIEAAEVCLAKPDVKVYRAFNLSLTFSETEKFCRNLGGAVAVADSQQSLERMLEAHSESCGLSSNLYSGYTDREEEGDWRDVRTGASLAWQHWEPNSPNNFYQADWSTDTAGAQIIIFLPQPLVNMSQRHC